jgi:hypothetical protein
MEVCMTFLPYKGEGVYLGMRDGQGKPQVFRQVDVLLLAGLGPGENPRDVFEWGQPGQGSRRLALSILCDYLRNDQKAASYCIDFADAVLANLPKQSFCIFGTQIQAFIDTMDKVRGSDASQ